MQTWDLNQYCTIGVYSIGPHELYDPVISATLASKIGKTSIPWTRFRQGERLFSVPDPCQWNRLYRSTHWDPLYLEQ